jgi:hypothetical protein
MLWPQQFKKHPTFSSNKLPRIWTKQASSPDVVDFTILSIDVVIYSWTIREKDVFKLLDERHISKQSRTFASMGPEK